MSELKTLLRADSTEWLLEVDNPSVRYLTLTTILGEPSTSRDVKRAKAEIMKNGIVPKIMSRQSEGSWNPPGRFYTDKYKGTTWQLIILAEHQADGEDPRIEAACEYVLRCAQDLESFGFSYKSKGESGGAHNDVIPCLTGNMVWSLIKLGYGKDDRVKKGLRWITNYQRFDDGAADKPGGWPYDRYEMCWGRHSCHMGVVKALKALSAVPEAERTGEIKETIKKACEYLLAHHVYKQSHNLAKVSKPGWLTLQFPLMYQTDILEVAGILVDLGIRDPRMADGIERIAAKQNAKGRWSLEGTFNGRFWVNIEKKGMPSKWITYRALKVLKKHAE